jgi:hypothetical protein
MYFSASMAFPVLSWSRRWSGETQGIRESPMLPDVDFRTFSQKHKNGFVRRVKCFVEPPARS